jgi:hypothetical protein
MYASRSAGAMRRRPQTNAERRIPEPIARSNDRLERPEANCASSRVNATFDGQVVVKDM